MRKGQVVVCINPHDLSAGQAPLKYGAEYRIRSVIEYGQQVTLRGVTTWTGVRFWPSYSTKRFVSRPAFRKQNS